MTNEMTAEEAVKILKEQQAEFNEKWVDYGRVNKAYNKAIKALETQPCEDCISRAEVIDGIERYIEKAQSTGTKDDFISFQELVVKQLPSVTPQRPKGKWIKIEYDVCTFIYKCSKCGMRVVNPYKYCPNCGSDNGGKKE